MKRSTKHELAPIELWRRRMLAIFAIVFVLAGVLIDQLPLFDASEGSRQMFSNSLFKVGIVLGLAWVAAPQLAKIGWEKMEGSLLLAIVVVLILWSIRPRIGTIAGGILLGTLAVFGLMRWLRKSTLG
jgi:hypothetical protein